MSRQLDLDSLSASFAAIARQRGWSELHTPRNLACAISVEAAELLALFQWQLDGSTRPEAAPPARERVAEELADILLYCNALADALAIDLKSAVQRKAETNARRAGEGDERD